jgi:hypothetical protein
LNDTQLTEKERKIENKKGEIILTLLKPSSGELKCIAKNSVNEERAICQIEINGKFKIKYFF